MASASVASEARQRVPGIRAIRQAARREDALRAAASVFRSKGMGVATMADIAATMGVSKMILYRRYPSKEALVEALFDHVVGTVAAADHGQWQGYGSRMHATLIAIRNVEDGYVSLVRDGNIYAPANSHSAQLRAHTSGIIRATLRFPVPEESGDAVAAALCIETIVSFVHEALVWWVQHGINQRDDEFLSWFAYIIRAWREGSFKVFGLGAADFVAPSGPVVLPSG